MHKFRHHLSVGGMGATHLPHALIGLQILLRGLGGASVFVSDPFGVDRRVFGEETPESYGVTLEDAIELKRLNAALDTAVDASLDAGCLVIQKALGETDGGFAGIHFSGDARDLVRTSLALYMVAQAEEVHANAEDADAGGPPRDAARG